MENIGKDPVLFWDTKVPDTELEKFQKIVEGKYNIKFDTYWDLHKWTVDNYTAFLEELWQFFSVIHSEPYKEVQVKNGPGFLDNEWFKGAKLNYAENMLRIRDDRIALIYLDELGNEETVTFANMYEEVKMYAAAFRKNGLTMGDRVACFMSNRKEAIFAMLAAASIGAIFGGPLPYYGAKAASNIASMMEPKFLITVDQHRYNGALYNMLDFLPEILENAPTVQKVILVLTQQETRRKDTRNIRNLIVLEDFLEEGRTPDGRVPDIIFEQLPFDHPLSINFTSGTTGSPKVPVHSAGTMLTNLRDIAFSIDLKSGDVFCLNYPVGWNLWDNSIPCLALGVTCFLYCGSPFVTINGLNFWDIMAKYKVTYVYLVTSIADKMEKMEMKPSPESDLSALKIVAIGSSPVKRHNIEYLLSLKKGVFVGLRCGATEMFGFFAGYNMNMPAYMGEIQVPALGIDLQCFDSSGKSVVGQRGEAVVCSPAINFPTGLWKDQNKSLITSLYLSKFPAGVWVQHDECWINPKTKGLVIIGRSDDTINQNDTCFGSADIYFAIHSLDELEDFICVGQQKYDGYCRAVLFVKMRQRKKFTPEIKVKIEKKIEEELLINCVPELILEIPDIPYNLNNKRMESLVRKIIQKNEVPQVMNIRNPECLKYYVNIPEVLSYNQQ